MTIFYRSENFTASHSSDTVSLDVTYKIKDSVRSVHKWNLKLNDKIILNSKFKNDYLNLWKYYIDISLSTLKTNRILIIGGGNQLLSNYLLSKYPCNITILDPLAYLYLTPNFKNILKTKMFVNCQDKNDLELRKMVPVDMTLIEAYEDGILEDNSFDMILVDNYIDTLYTKSKMYEENIPQYYYDLLKEKGVLIINHNFSLKKITNKMKSSLDNVDLDIVQDDINYYNIYLNKLNDLLCETDHIFKLNTKLTMYCKVFPGMI